MLATRLLTVAATAALLFVSGSIRAQPEPDEPLATEPTSFAGTAVPGLVQAEDYDAGGEGVAYHDKYATNQGLVYRSDGVDLKVVADGSTVVGWFEASEWLNYTLNVPDDGEYDITLRLGSAYAPSRSLIVRLDGVELGRVSVPAIPNWDAPLQESTLQGVNLPAGTHILQLAPGDLDWIDVDWLRVAPADETVAEAAVAPAVSLPAEPLPTCATSLQSLVDRTPAAETLRVPQCVYRETVRVSRPIVLDGAGQAEIRGSDVWTDWRRDDRGWHSTSTLPPFNYSRKIECVNDRCHWPEQVFFDDRPLEQVAANARPGAGQFAVDANRQVILGDDPNGHTVEVTVRNRWIDVQSDGVTIQGFRMRASANEAQIGGIGNQSRSNFVLQDNVLSDAHGAIVSLGGGTNLKLLRNDISRGGQEGVSGYQATNTLIQQNRIHHNNTEGFKPEWEAGGLKVVAYRDAVLDGNDVFANNGPGLWCDIACRGITFTNNRVHDNIGGPGIFFEISEGAEITRNSVWNTSGNWAGIFVSSSSGASVHDNLVAWSSVGISVLLVDRGDRPASAGVGNNVFNNTVVMPREDSIALEWAQYGSGRMYEADANNRASNNAFWYPAEENGQSRFTWRNRFTRLSEFASTPGGRASRYLSSSDRDRLLAARSMPMTP
jgi:Right handed beta helix region